MRWAAVVLCLWSGGAAAQMGPIRLDGIAATVGGRGPGPGVEVILHSDVELRAALKLAGRGVVRRRDVQLPAALLRATLDEMLGEHLIEREAQRIRATAPRGLEVRAELRRLYEASGGQQAVHALLDARGAAVAELRKVARRRAVVAAFLRSNLEGTTVVTEAEVDAALAEAAAADAADSVARNGAAAGVARSRESVRLRLRRRALDASIAHWVRVLRSRIAIRVYAQYGSG